MMALTTATPSTGFALELPLNMTEKMLEALSPPIQTTGTVPWPFLSRTSRVCLSPSGPMTDLVFFFLRGVNIEEILVGTLGGEHTFGLRISSLHQDSLHLAHRP